VNRGKGSGEWGGGDEHNSGIISQVPNRLTELRDSEEGGEEGWGEG